MRNIEKNKQKQRQRETLKRIRKYVQRDTLKETFNTQRHREAFQDTDTH